MNERLRRPREKWPSGCCRKYWPGLYFRNRRRSLRPMRCHSAPFPSRLRAGRNGRNRSKIFSARRGALTMQRRPLRFNRAFCRAACVPVCPLMVATL